MVIDNYKPRITAMATRKFRITTTDTDYVMGKGYRYASDKEHLFKTIKSLGSSLVKVEKSVQKCSILGPYKEWVKMTDEELNVAV